MYHDLEAVFEARVARGVAYLHSVVPTKNNKRWYENIKLDILDVGCDYRCVLYQVCGVSSYTKACQVMQLSRDEAQDFGFTLDGISSLDIDAQYKILTAVWKRAILALRKGTSVGAVAAPRCLELA